MTATLMFAKGKEGLGKRTSWLFALCSFEFGQVRIKMRMNLTVYAAWCQSAYSR